MFSGKGRAKLVFHLNRRKLIPEISRSVTLRRVFDLNLTWIRMIQIFFKCGLFMDNASSMYLCEKLNLGTKWLIPTESKEFLKTTLKLWLPIFFSYLERLECRLSVGKQFRRGSRKYVDYFLQCAIWIRVLLFTPSICPLPRDLKHNIVSTISIFVIGVG